ncbi:MAG TPA: plastocyanin/azurin family copper-binding protein [Mycobacterium sp.]|nr:plastocyanin/azurin family copper-binding protein [Mycobacterium sp.]
MRIPIVFPITVALLALLSAPVLAGGWAVVRLDEPPGEVVAGTPWRFGFMVLQHDVTPTSDVSPVVRAYEQATGEEVTFAAEQEGPEGHFVVEVTFPRAGDWKWEIVPDPFNETTFETLSVVEQAGMTSSSWRAGIYSGACNGLGDEVFAIGDVGWKPPVVKSTQLPIAMGSATVDASLSELLDARHVIAVKASTTDPEMVACGTIEDVSGAAPNGEGELVLGLQHGLGVQGGQAALDVGVAVLRPDGEQTEVTLYVPTRDWQAIPSAPAAMAIVEIVGGEANGAVFAPPSLTVAPGTQVTWFNNAKSAHMVSSDELSFDDSGWIAPGGSFSHTFTEPGKFNYRCGPHPWMEGTVVVA